jgi:hypothetical protein
VFETVELPAGVADLDAGLADVDAQTLAHLDLVSCSTSEFCTGAGDRGGGLEHKTAAIADCTLELKEKRRRRGNKGGGSVDEAADQSRKV